LAHYGFINKFRPVFAANVKEYPTPHGRLRGVPKAEERSDEAGMLS